MNLNSLLGNLGKEGSGKEGSGSNIDMKKVLELVTELSKLKKLPEVQNVINEASSKNNQSDQLKVVQDFITKNKNNEKLKGSLTSLLPKVLDILKSTN